jgi:glutamine synthetase
MFQDRDEACRYARDHGIEQVDLKIVNPFGGLNHVTIQASALGDRLFDRGVGFDGSSIGFRSIESGDLVLIPDPTTGFRDPSGAVRPSRSSAT